QAEDGIRDGHVTGVQTCALPICAYGNVCSIMRIISGQRNVGISAYCAGKKTAAKIDNLQSIIGKEQSCGDAIEEQSFSKEIVVRSEERRVGKECRYRRGTAA